MAQEGNYCAFYVAEPFNQSGLGANATKDFVFYNLLRSWSGLDSSFPFLDSHKSTYSVRDGSDWELTLKPRLRERLRNSKNIILFLSERTRNSRALREEIEYGVGELGLPLIVIYPDFETKESLLLGGQLKTEVKALWDKLPTLSRLIGEVPSLHIPLNKRLIESALNNSDFMVQTKCRPDIFRYKDR